MASRGSVSPGQEELDILNIFLSSGDVPKGPTGLAHSSLLICNSTVSNTWVNNLEIVISALFQLIRAMSFVTTSMIDYDGLDIFCTKKSDL